MHPDYDYCQCVDSTEHSLKIKRCFPELAGDEACYCGTVTGCHVHLQGPSRLFPDYSANFCFTKASSLRREARKLVEETERLLSVAEDWDRRGHQTLKTIKNEGGNK